MMSADEVLYQAAKVLREHVERLPERWRNNPWRAVYTDTETRDGLAVCRGEHDGYGAYDCCWSGESVGHEAVASLAALMHPPVALALAALFEAHAAIAVLAGSDVDSPEFCHNELIAVARAVLEGSINAT